LRFSIAVSLLVLSGQAWATRGTIPNVTRPSAELNQPITVQMGAIHHNQPTIIDGYVLLSGDGQHELWDISGLGTIQSIPYRTSTNFRQLWHIQSPESPGINGHGGEAESHQVTLCKIANRDGNGDVTSYSTYLATITGTGVDIWDISVTNQPPVRMAPKGALVSTIVSPNVNYGDVDNAVWGLSCQGKYLYVGATNNGLHIVDMSNPAAPVRVASMPTTLLSGIKVGPLFAIGDLLVLTTPKNNAGVATLDISNPTVPVLKSSVTSTSGSYIGGVFGRYAHLLGGSSPGGFRWIDILAPTLTISAAANTKQSEYMSYGTRPLNADGTGGLVPVFYLGGTRTAIDGEPGIHMYRMNDPLDGSGNSSPSLTFMADIPGGDRNGTANPNIDDQFSIPAGNLLVMSDDEGTFGSRIAVQMTATDTSRPAVMYVNPASGATNVSVKSRIAVSMTESIEFTSVTVSSFKLVKQGTATPVQGRWGSDHTFLSFTPEAALDPGTTYEVVLAAGGVTDYVGNALLNEYRSTFTTAGTQQGPPPCGISRSTSAQVQVGTSITFNSQNPDTSLYSYEWNFGDGTGGTGPSLAHSYSSPGRYPATLTVASLAAGTTSVNTQAESATLSGGVVVANDHPGYEGTGFADYPNPNPTDPRTVFVRWTASVTTTGSYDLQVRFANGGTTARPLNLYVNGVRAGTMTGAVTGDWTSWAVETLTAVPLSAGTNTLELAADAGAVGPNVDRISVLVADSLQSSTCSLTEVVYRPLTATAPTRSSTIIVSGGKAWAVNPDANTITAVITSTSAKAFEVDAGINPRTLAAAPNGEIWVANMGSDDVTIHSPTSGAITGIISFAHGSAPYGIAFSPDGTHAFVSLQEIGAVARLNVSSKTVSQVLTFSDDAKGITRKLRGIAVASDSTRVFVTRFISTPVTGNAPVAGDEAEVLELDGSATTMRLVRTFLLQNSTLPDAENHSRGVPNYLSSIAISPDGLHAWIPSKQDNMSRGAFRDGHPLTHETTMRPVVSRIDMRLTGSVVNDDLSARVDINDADSPHAAAFSAHGDLLFVAVQGNNQVFVVDAYSGTTVTAISTDLAPQGLALDATAGRLYVQNFMGRTMTVHDVAALLSGTNVSVSQLASVPLVANELLSPTVLKGKQIFYNAADARMSRQKYISCASCHLDGSADGRVWDFTDRGEGFRSSVDLRGRSGMGHGRVHWTGNFDEIQDFENDIRNSFLGLGFMTNTDFAATSDALGAPKSGKSADLDALAAYVSSLIAVPQSPYRNEDGSLSTAAAAGKTLLTTKGCTSCHAGSQLTDSKVDSSSPLHDVGTIMANSGKRRGTTLTGFDTPTLLGVWATAPYLHNGAAPTLASVLTNTTHVGSLTPTEKNQILAYLEEADGHDVLFNQTFQAEDATLGGGVVVAVDHTGYDGTGFADYPTTTGSTVHVTWTVPVTSAGTYNLNVRYANGGVFNRSLTVYVNGISVGTVTFVPTTNWDTWAVVTKAGFTLKAGSNTIALVADAGSVGPNVDEVTVRQ